MRPQLALLDDSSPLPVDRPFTSSEAAALGVSRHLIRHLLREGYLRKVFHGIFVATQVPDSVDSRAAALSLVVPPTAIATDRTAAWLHGVPILPRTRTRDVPPLQIFSDAESRLRRPGVSSGIRALEAYDITTVGSVRVTTPLRTALDLGRLLWRFDALAALDGFLRAGVSHLTLLAQVERFRGYRGVVQLRALAEIADARAESPAESALRLHWLESGAPTPEPQVWVYDGDRPRYRLDLGLEECRFGAEYDGEQFHGPGQQAHDAARRAWLTDECGWTIQVFTSKDVYDPNANPGARISEGIRTARRRAGIA